MEEYTREDLKRDDKKLTDKWREEAAQIPDSTQEKIMDMKRAYKSVRQICDELELAIEHVSAIVIDGFANLRSLKVELRSRLNAVGMKVSDKRVDAVMSIIHGKYGYNEIKNRESDVSREVADFVKALEVEYTTLLPPGRSSSGRPDNPIPPGGRNA